MPFSCIRFFHTTKLKTLVYTISSITHCIFAWKSNEAAIYFTTSAKILWSPDHKMNIHMYGDQYEIVE